MSRPTCEEVHHQGQAPDQQVVALQAVRQLQQQVQPALQLPLLHAQHAGLLLLLLRLRGKLRWLAR